MIEPKFAPGFRLSALDVVVLVLSGAAAAYFASLEMRIGLAIGFVVVHFFLFCNVLRMSRALELIWAGVFSALAIAAVRFSFLPWFMVFVISTCVTLVLGIVEMRKPSYHGIGWKKLNPGLPEWWRSCQSRTAANTTFD